MNRFLTLQEVLTIHENVVEESGGSHGVRDEGLVASAVLRPQTTFSGEQLYPDLFTQAAALLHSLTRNHPFVDGNKRTGYVATALFLELNGYQFTASHDDLLEFVLNVATGELEIVSFCDLVNQFLKLISPLNYLLKRSFAFECC